MQVHKAQLRVSEGMEVMFKRSILFLAVASAVPVMAQTPPPAYTSVRWSEDYSYLKDASKRTDFFDPIKYIPLGADDFYLSVGGQVRERYEYFNHNNFGAGPQDENGYWLNRVLLNLDLHVGPNVRVF